ncbi:MAG: potassium channel protein [Cytophagales bacterium]|nr:potassium channel protein [Cytophagales bacterium]
MVNYKDSFFLLNRRIKRFYLALGSILFSIGGGALFYVQHEGYSWTNAFYMAIITLSTTGFMEVMPLSETGRIFTSVYILVNLGLIAFGVTTLTAYFFEGELRNIFKRIMKGREVQKLKNHVIICGYGRNGSQVCEEFLAAGQDFIVIEKDPEVIKTIPDHPKYNSIQGDASLDEILRLARVEYAKAIITTLPKDADNVFISLTVRELNPKVQVIARSNEPHSEKKLRIAGASQVVRPDALGGSYMAHLVIRPVVIEFLELLNGLDAHSNLHLEEFSITDFKKEFQNKTIRELDIRKRTGVTVLGYKHPERGFLFTPSTSLTLNQDSFLILLGSEDAIANFFRLFKK